MTTGAQQSRPEGWVEDSTKEASEGRSAGQTAGKVSGRTKGKVKMLTRLLRHRFGTLPQPVLDWLRQASDCELDRCSNQLFDAESLEALTGIESVTKVQPGETAKIAEKPKSWADYWIEGWKEGLATGEPEGSLGMFKRALRSKFGKVPWVVLGRVEQASIEELNAWSNQLIDAESLEAMFPKEAAAKERAGQFRAEGLVEMFARLLQHRFGNRMSGVVLDRLMEASDEDMDHWGARLFYAVSLDAVFDTGCASPKAEHPPKVTIRQQLKIEGRAEGQAKGIAKVLTRQLRHKFGTVPQATQDRLVWASAKELEEWSTRLFDAESLEAVFDTASQH